MTQTILQNVEVLTAGEKIEPDPQGKPQTVNVVTLLLTPEDSEKLLLASTQGSIQFVMRNGVDQHKLNTEPIRLSELVTGIQPAPAPARSVHAVHHKPRPAPKQADIYVLEMIQGEKRSVVKF